MAQTLDLLGFSKHMEWYTEHYAQLNIEISLIRG